MRSPNDSSSVVLCAPILSDLLISYINIINQMRSAISTSQMVSR